jgi:uncharacterized protein YyaL (SSP411 family)
LSDVRHFALRSLDRLLSQGWAPAIGLKHVITYSDPNAAVRDTAGVLDDYAFTVLACLDAYEASSDLTYFNFAQHVAEAMIERFHDPQGGGFFDTAGTGETLGAMAARRKPFQDAPTPAGNSSAAIGLLRLYAYTNEARYRDVARGTLEVIAGVAEQFGLFAATYAIAGLLLARPHTQVVVVGNDEKARELYRAALMPFSLNKAVLCLTDNEAAPQYLPPALRDTVPALPAVRSGATTAIVCANFTCLPPVDASEALARTVREAISGNSVPRDVSAAD